MLLVSAVLNSLCNLRVCVSDMHQNFQQDLIRLRLVAANAFVQNLNDQYGMGNATEQLKISAQVKQLR